MFAIETELSQRQVDLERLRASQRNTQDLVALATLTVQVDYRTPDALQDIAESDDGIGDAFTDGWNAFVATIFALGYVLAVAAPFLITGIAVAWLVGRRWSRRQAALGERRRLDANRAGDLVGHQTASASGGTPPPPMVADRVSDGPESTQHEGDTLVEHDSPEHD